MTSKLRNIITKKLICSLKDTDVVYENTSCHYINDTFNVRADNVDVISLECSEGWIMRISWLYIESAVRLFIDKYGVRDNYFEENLFSLDDLSVVLEWATLGSFNLKKIIA